MLSERKITVYRLLSIMLAVIIWFAATEMSVAQEGAAANERSVEWGITLGAGAAQAILNPSAQPWALGYDLRVGWDLRLSETWRLAVHAARRQYWDDTTTTAKFKLPKPTEKAANIWNSTVFNLSVRRIFSPEKRWHPYVQAGLGLTRWDIADYSSGEILEVAGEDGSPEKYEATELHTNLGAGLEYDLSSSISARAGLDFYYLTGVGTSFAEPVDDFRSRGNIVFSLALTAYFGGGEAPAAPRPDGWLMDYPDDNRTPAADDEETTGEAEQAAPDSSQAEQRKFEPTDYDKDGDGVHDATDLCPDTPLGAVVDAYGCPPDEDGDGVIDLDDQCPLTPVGAFVDSNGCPSDSDGDQVYDGLDFCPDTPARDIAHVDNTGCVSDRDRDRIPDYRDDCPDSKPGTVVNALGCIADGDGDGILDSLDVCPNSPRGLAVDQDGCLVMTQLSRKLLLFPDFEPGWDKLDIVSLKILDDLASRLQRAPNVFVHIRAYTDNIGEATANEYLSQRRADRARLHLIDQGISPERIRAIGLGEVDFIASNDTATGRKRNRRLEISFEH